MSFTLSLLIVVAAAAVGLALVASHLSRRLHDLEQAVQGGLGAPGGRLTREQFERRFRTAGERARLAEQVGNGLVIVAGADHAIGSLIAHLPRADGLTLIGSAPPAPPAGLTVLERSTLDLEGLGVAIEPFVFIVEDRRIIEARPVTGTDDLERLVSRRTEPRS